MKIYCAHSILGKYLAHEDHTHAYGSVIFAVLFFDWTFRFEGTESNGLKYGDKPGGFCQKSRECRTGEDSVGSFERC